MNDVPSDRSALSRIDPSLLNSSYVKSKASKPLRICCYGSSSSETPERYVAVARSLGYILAKRGHTCVNGAGAFGCMAAMNDGADLGNGHIIGVIHEMWLQQPNEPTNVRDGGAHRIFLQSTENAASINTNNSNTATTTITASWDGPKREMLVAKGKDLQERKRLLVENADAVIVLPGGPGTWDELWEMVCARGIGLSNIPIICINCYNFYEPFYTMLQRAYDDKLTKFLPHELVQFVATAEEAVQWVEATCSNSIQPPSASLSENKKRSILRSSSIMHTPLVTNMYPYGTDQLLRIGLLFTTGVVFGIILTSSLVGTKQWQLSSKR
jgi:uncharacterized protein (TIGR00730 family)